MLFSDLNPCPGETGGEGGGGGGGLLCVLGTQAPSGNCTLQTCEHGMDEKKGAGAGCVEYALAHHGLSVIRSKKKYAECHAQSCLSSLVWVHTTA